MKYLYNSYNARSNSYNARSNGDVTVRRAMVRSSHVVLARECGQYGEWYASGLRQAHAALVRP